MKAFRFAIRTLVVIVILYVIYDVWKLEGESLKVLLSYFKLLVQYIQDGFEILAGWLEPFRFQPET